MEFEFRGKVVVFTVRAPHRVGVSRRDWNRYADTDLLDDGVGARAHSRSIIGIESTADRSVADTIVQ